MVCTATSSTASGRPDASYASCSARAVSVSSSGWRHWLASMPCHASSAPATTPSSRWCTMVCRCSAGSQCGSRWRSCSTTGGRSATSDALASGWPSRRSPSPSAGPAEFHVFTLNLRRVATDNTGLVVTRCWRPPRPALLDQADLVRHHEPANRRLSPATVPADRSD